METWSEDRGGEEDVPVLFAELGGDGRISGILGKHKKNRNMGFIVPFKSDKKTRVICFEMN